MLKQTSLAVLAAAVLFGCASERPRQVNPLSNAKVDCIGGKTCDVEVTVDANGNIAVPGTLYVTGKNVHIVWHITTKGYEFRAADGILFKDPNDNDTCEFTGRHALDETGIDTKKSNGRHYHWHDRNSIARSYEYQIIVIDAKTGAVFTVDPGIVNQG